MQKGNLKIVCELTKGNVNVNAAMTTDGTNALMWASQEGHLEVVRLLLMRGADKRFEGGGRSAYSVASGPNKAALQALLSF